jgi:hypothetical protein
MNLPCLPLLSRLAKTLRNTVIDVTKFYSTDVKSISGLSAAMRETYKVKGLDDSRSFINTMRSFPMNRGRSRL